MNLGGMAKHVERLVADNASLILTSVGVTGVITTAILTAKATFKAAVVLEEVRKDILIEEDRVPETKEVVKALWKLYMPPVASAALTVVAIIGTHHVGARKAAALASAYTIVDRTFTEYRAKIVETMGDKKEQGVRDALAQDRVNNQPITSREVIILEESVLFFDGWSGRYFESNMETVRRAVNDINHKINHDFYATLTDFYDLIELRPTTESDYIGWNTDRMIGLSYSGVLIEGKPAISIEFTVLPSKTHFSMH